ncbi:Uncharacterised protein [uncultured archaeon]|nr:Uncharacterised protein [uncultured archaeon]
MPDFFGPKGVFNEIAGGFLLGLAVPSISVIFVNMGVISRYHLMIFNLLSTIGSIGLIQDMPYWGLGYLLGWAFSLYMLYVSGWIAILEIMVYFGVPFVVFMVEEGMK